MRGGRFCKMASKYPTSKTFALQNSEDYLTILQIQILKQVLKQNARDLRRLMRSRSWREFWEILRACLPSSKTLLNICPNASGTILCKARAFPEKGGAPMTPAMDEAMGTETVIERNYRAHRFSHLDPKPVFRQMPSSIKIIDMIGMFATYHIDDLNRRLQANH